MTFILFKMFFYCYCYSYYIKFLNLIYYLFNTLCYFCINILYSFFFSINLFNIFVYFIIVHELLLSNPTYLLFLVYYYDNNMIKSQNNPSISIVKLVIMLLFWSIAKCYIVGFYKQLSRYDLKSSTRLLSIIKEYNSMK